MKVGDIVYHKTNPRMGMVVTELPEQNVDCVWWDEWQHRYDSRTFAPEELLDGEQQSKQMTPGGKDGS